MLNRERRGEPGLQEEELAALQDKAEKAGLFGVHTPEEYGGMGLGAVMNALVEVELGRSFVPFRFGDEADNILYLANDEQKQKYLVPTINGERTSCFAITRARGRLRRPRHPHLRQTGGRRVGDQRRGDLHHRRQRSRLHYGVCGH